MYPRAEKEDMTYKVPTVLTIAGSDCSGGAGIQADLKTIAAHKLYGMSVICALTAQNTMKVASIQDASAEIVAQQMDCVFSDIYPDAVKIGMVSNSEIIETIAYKLAFHGPRNIVLDPVMISSTGSRLITEEAQQVLIDRLLPMADIVTPNIPEAEVFSGMAIRNRDDMVKAASIIAARISQVKREGGSYWGHVTILLKGGHLDDEASDLIYSYVDEEGVGKTVETTWVSMERIDNPNTHGTGCTLSSAIACNLALGAEEVDAIRKAKEYLTGAIGAGLDLGHGSGPLDHMYQYR
jgi:hydroxymethylpyrimidine/phosphomethylpyrimidine kinase